MPSKFTENFGLNLWDASDRVHHDDFNEDNRKIDAALGTLSGRLGKLEIIKIQKSVPEVVSGFFGYFSEIDWDQWEYVGMLLYCPPANDQNLGLWCELEGYVDGKVRTTQMFKDLTMPGFLFLFLPQHDGNRQTAGFLFSDRFIPFTSALKFKELRYTQISTTSSTMTPTLVFFGGK